MATLEIREFDGSNADYETWCAIERAIEPEHAFTAQETKDWD